MSQVLINEYLAELDRLKKASGSTRETIVREAFTYRFADHKERVATLLARVVRVSVETVRIVDALKAGPR